MSTSTQFYRNLVGLGNIGVGTTTVPTSNIQVTGNVYASNALVSPLILGTHVGTHYGVLAGSNTVSASTFTGSGASLTNLPLNQFTGLTAGGVAYGSASTTIATNSAGTSGQALLSGGGGAPTWGTLSLLYGGTGQTTAQSAINTLAGAVTNAQYLRGNGTNVVMSAIQASDVPILNQNTTGSSGSCTGNSATATTAASCSGNSATATTAASCSGNTAGSSGSCTGNSATATSAASCSGNSATATTATNQSGGTVSCSSASSTGYIGALATVPGVATRSTGGFIVYNDGNFNIEMMQRTSAVYGLNFITRNSDGVFSWRKTSGLTNWGTELLYLDNGGNLTATGDIIAYSDARVKTNLQKIEGALDKVSQINGYTFTRIDEVDKDKRHAGVIAQEIQKVLPEVVTVNEVDGTLGVAYGNLTALLVEALKEERKAREALEERIARLELKERISM